MAEEVDFEEGIVTVMSRLTCGSPCARSLGLQSMCLLSLAGQGKNTRGMSAAGSCEEVTAGGIRVSRVSHRNMD